MARSRGELNYEYLNAKGEDFSADVQTLLKIERDCYEQLKQAKAMVLDQVKAELDVGNGREIKATAYTRWGQWQIVIGDKVQPKPAAQQRETLAQYRARMAGEGRSV
jgi:hypothetical protein